MNKAIEIIVSHLKRKELAIFCGAGISVPSGIPAVGSYDEKSGKIAEGIVTKILSSIGFTDKQLISFFKEKMPFEAFMEFLIQDGLNLKDIIKVFDGEPSYYHKAIAGLLNDNLLHQICTTNFDRCFEKAFDEYGIADFPVYYKMNQFQEFLREPVYRSLIKIHGCISDPANMAITIKEIARKESRKRDHVTRYFFSKSTFHQVLLIIGYSCSDHFDISPVVRQLILKNQNLCKIIFWEFESDKSPVQIDISAVGRNSRDLFENHPDIVCIKGDLKDLFEALIPIKNEGVCVSTHWQEIIEKHYRQKAKSENLLLRGKVLYQIDERASANDLFDKVIGNQEAQQKDLAVAYSSKGLILKHWGMLKQSLKLQREAEKIYRKLKDKRGLIVAIGNQALVLRRLGKFKEALELHQAEGEICQALNDQNGIARSIGNSALVLKYMDDLEGALALHKQEQEIFILTGDKGGEARSYGNQSLILRRKGLLTEALRLLIEEERIYLDLGKINLLCHNYETQALVYSDMGDLCKPMIYHKKAEEIYLVLRDEWGLTTTLVNQGAFLAKKLGKTLEGCILIENGIEIARQTGDGRIKEFTKILKNITG